MYLKKVLFFTPIFLFLYGISSYNMHLSLFEDPFGQIASEAWVKESPIQFFIGYVLNLILNNTILTYWLVVVLGFIFLLFSICKILMIYGDYCIGVHLFPFRTEKLSPIALMVLGFPGRVSRRLF